MDAQHRGIRNLISALAEAPQPWRRDGACAQVPLDAVQALFFTDRGGQNEARAAKAICKVCPVSTDCLRYAVLTSQRYGIWGGKTELERRGLRKALVSTVSAA